MQHTASVGWFWHKHGQAKSKLARSKAPAVKLHSSSAPISNVEVNNIDSAGYAIFTQWVVIRTAIKS